MIKKIKNEKVSNYSCKVASIESNKDGTLFLRITDPETEISFYGKVNPLDFSDKEINIIFNALANVHEDTRILISGEGEWIVEDIYILRITEIGQIT